MSGVALLGGEVALRDILYGSVERVFDDVMSGSIIIGKSRDRLSAMAFRLAAGRLGAPHTYGRQDIAKVHAGLPSRGGHFLRRRTMLLDTLEAHDVSEGVNTRWFDHVGALRDDSSGAGNEAEHCDHVAQGERGSHTET